LIVPRADAQNHDDGPTKTNRKPGAVKKTKAVVDGMETLDDRDTWFDEAGEEATKAEEEADLRKMAADTTPHTRSAHT
jgi:hypothetical protein